MNVRVMFIFDKLFLNKIHAQQLIKTHLTNNRDLEDVNLLAKNEANPDPVEDKAAKQPRSKFAYVYFL
jgi:hypothetical protein